MEGFDTTTMSYLATPMLMQNVHGPEQQQQQHMAMPMNPMDQYDQRSVFDNETFAYAVAALRATKC
jgi:hypothetical protein